MANIFIVFFFFFSFFAFILTILALSVLQGNMKIYCWRYQKLPVIIKLYLLTYDSNDNEMTKVKCYSSLVKFESQFTSLVFVENNGKKKFPLGDGKT